MRRLGTPRFPFKIFHPDSDWVNVRGISGDCCKPTLGKPLRSPEFSMARFPCKIAGRSHVFSSELSYSLRVFQHVMRAMTETGASRFENSDPRVHGLTQASWTTLSNAIEIQLIPGPKLNIQSCRRPDTILVFVRGSRPESCGLERRIVMRCWRNLPRSCSCISVSRNIFALWIPFTPISLGVGFYWLLCGGRVGSFRSLRRRNPWLLLQSPR